MPWVAPMKKTFWEEIYDLAENRQCWLSECDLCKDGQKKVQTSKSY